MRRDIFTDEHDAFRETARTFAEREIVPHHGQWEEDGLVPRELWTAAGRQGLLCVDLPEKYGGAGLDDFRYHAIVAEELARSRATGVGFVVHNDMAVPYLSRLATEEQKDRWFSGLCAGELIAAIAMSEPGAGSDLQGIATTAVRDGEDYVLNGQKTFITNGIHADLVIVLARTDPEAAHLGFSLFAVERGMEGFERGRKLDKIGMRAQDTAELFFNDVRIPAANLVGEEGKGFIYLMEGLPRERLAIAVVGQAGAEAVFDETVEYVRGRKAFGRNIGKFQHVRMTMAEMKTELHIGRTFVDQCMLALNAGELDVTEAAMSKWWITEMQKRVTDQCLQLHGGYGYMSEYPIAQAYLDTRAQTIYGGTTEIMKEIIGRSLDL
ncbi:acyl-CoA dehydrogenase family protein [Stackebrandtia nassauensis]|uniref:Acyl-CoA dehydrogenase domain protein n=1 Tax=Stackebrandtia nassauensis (strain DSM 44728 / CIP 108903 / NRRL B-16338 / NBRC 102104 / LLR-40K-21) TaxID=446470 RepID=D3PYX1_STANL|nr:acyl-CoA dehydrogenase family protein [Stackebrandtia nassauensis]ADD43554.1 acyl-CoA dehydrogenase domain protein [Stackebrandtia nassauensis DSM 44728]